MNSMEKEIHFFKDETSLLGYYPKFTTHNETWEAIKAGKPIIYTTAISALDFAHLLDNKYRIYLHEQHRYFELRTGNVDATDKEIRRAHDVRKIWIGGGFNDFFYGNNETEV